MKSAQRLSQPQGALTRAYFLLAITLLLLSNTYGQAGGPNRKDFTSSGQAEVARGDLISAPVTFTQVRQTLTILFGNAKASLGNNIGNVSEPLNATWAAAVRVPAD